MAATVELAQFEELLMLNSPRVATRYVNMMEKKRSLQWHPLDQKTTHISTHPEQVHTTYKLENGSEERWTRFNRGYGSRRRTREF